MDKQAVRRTLDQLAAFLELQGGNAARVRAVRHAARSELLATGRSSALDELREQVSPGLAEMLRIPGLGAAKVRQIHESLAIESLAELEAAAGDGRLAALPRFGAKTAENVRRGIAHLRQASSRSTNRSRSSRSPSSRPPQATGAWRRCRASAPRPRRTCAAA